MHARWATGGCRLQSRKHDSCQSWYYPQFLNPEAEAVRRALEHEDVVSYGEVTHATLGRKGQRLVEVLLIISQAGAALPPSSPFPLNSYVLILNANLQ